MSASTKLGDEFLRIPKLDVSGSNWVIFKDRFTWALDARGILEHIDGTTSEPKDPISAEERKKAKDGLTMEQKRLETEWKKDVKDWKQHSFPTRRSSDLAIDKFVRVQRQSPGPITYRTR